MIYLASNSLRRRQLLDQIGVTYEHLLIRSRTGRVADVDETPLDDEPALIYVQRIAIYKAQIAWDRARQRGLPSYPILAADTTVAFENQILGKPRDQEEAAYFLQQLSGKSHQVLTAISIIQGEKIESALSVTEVVFKTLSSDEIQRYTRNTEILDMAGAYGLQGKAATFVKHISGSDSGVKGLALYETAELLSRFGITV
ncbi:MAG: nucleoside triphosphate pyrophosphatase [Pseudomonadota bacterium]